MNGAVSFTVTAARRAAVTAALLLAGTWLGGAPAAAAEYGDPAAGEQVYQRCIGCHSLDRNRTGPRHCGLIGRRAGGLADFDYTQAMRAADLIWDQETLDRFLAAPMEVVPGTSMGFAGVRDAQDRRDLVAYLVAVNQSAKDCPQ